jgi:hypothetical protein
MHGFESKPISPPTSRKETTVTVMIMISYDQEAEIKLRINLMHELLFQ